MKKIICFLIFTILLSVNVLFAQPEIEWYKRFNYNANSIDLGTNMAVFENNIYILSSTQTTVYGETVDILTVKYNSLGHLIWYYKYNGTAGKFDEPIDIKCDSEGNAIVLGNSEGINTGLDLVLIKFNPNGSRQWISRFAGSGNSIDRFSSMFIDNQNNIVLAGISGSKLIIVKYSPQGSLLWNAIFNTYDGSGTDIECDNSGNVFVSGTCKRSPNDYDYILLKYSPYGVFQWVKYDGSVNYDYADFLAIDQSENIYISGVADSGGTVFMKTLKFASDGNLNWRSIIPFENLFGPDMAGFEIDQNNCAIGVFFMGGPIGTNKLYINKLNSDGSRQWKTDYPAVPRDVLLKNNNIYITGWDLLPNQMSKVMLLKYESNGLLSWNKRFVDDMYAVGMALGMDANDNIYVAGNAIVYTSNDVLLIKYSNVTGNINISSEIPKQFSLSQNYPNPFNPSTKIKFQIPSFASVALTFLSVYDVLGREIATLVNQQLQPGTYEVDWDASAYPSGVYFYKISSGIFTETKKMVLIK